MTRTKQLERLEPLVRSVVGAAGEELVDVELQREPSGWVLRVYVDHPLGAQAPDDATLAPITVDDCARVSHALSVALDAADLIAHEYSLEVSSPGLDRPLRGEEHFRRFVGKEAKVRLHDGVSAGPGGTLRKNFVGVIAGVESGQVRLRLPEGDVSGAEVRLPLADVAKASLLPEL